MKQQMLFAKRVQTSLQYNNDLSYLYDYHFQPRRDFSLECFRWSRQGDGESGGGGVRWHRLAREVRRGCPLVFYNCCIEDQTRHG